MKKNQDFLIVAYHYNIGLHFYEEQPFLVIIILGFPRSGFSSASMFVQ